jgi:hypothetical protein
MNNIQRVLLMAGIIMFFSLGLGLCHTQAQTELLLITNPNIREIRLDDQERPPVIAIIAQTKEKNPQYAWNLYGPGKLEGDLTRPGVFYTPPDSIDGTSTQVVITVAVINAEKQVSFGNVGLTFFAPTVTATPTPTPVKETSRIQIRQLRETKGTIIYPTYFVKPGSEVIIEVDQGSFSEPSLEVTYNAVFGTIEQRRQEVIYIAPNKSGSSDIITLRLVNQETGKILAQEDH